MRYFGQLQDDVENGFALRRSREIEPFEQLDIEILVLENVHIGQEFEVKFALEILECTKTNLLDRMT